METRALSNTSAAPKSTSDKHQLKLIHSFMKKVNYIHPLLVPTLNELGLSPNELQPKPIEEFSDKNSTMEVQMLRYSHYEARRQAKIEILSNTLFSKGLFAHKFDSATNSPDDSRVSTNSPSPLRIKRSLSVIHKEPDVTPRYPISPLTTTQRQVLLQQQKLDRFLRVQNNQKYLRVNKEKEIISKEIRQEMKLKKLEEDKALKEAERKQKIQENNMKRQEKLKRKYVEIQENETKALMLEEVINEASDERSKSSLTARASSRRMNE
ncbi:unnamed protein product [Blepharisma stoltei]|uniref:Uncharacterized protein n=1 Tax=Blepharisma stoltei TaxID=1481888 RepID=A0AAU9JXL5_9CILI|nr:unnamed protein product [Blepharisma stoltei]